MQNDRSFAIVVDVGAACILKNSNNADLSVGVVFGSTLNWIF